MKKLIRDKNGDILEFEINGYDLVNPLAYFPMGFTGGTDACHLRLNKRRWRTQKQVGDFPYMKKQPMRKE